MSQFHKYFKPRFRDLLITKVIRLLGVDIGKDSYVIFGAKLSRFIKKIKIGSSTVVKSNADLCVCNPDAKITIGNETTIGNYTFVYSSKGIDIGNRCLIAPFVYIVDSNHGIERAEPIRYQENIAKKIKIADDVWIGAHSIITAGSNIGEGAVIAANSVVRSDIGAYEIWAGVPAKKIGDR
ncbi:acyltransferase [Litoribrevibacter euphylliae]|uniref:Acyltransferase n=1 Tax=Litoribrevibacter euphylliae TaxID=1834034 RepID=A0ABV7HCL6_9GAMM